MSIIIKGQEVPVEVAPPADKNAAIGSDLVVNWVNSLDESFTVKKIDVQSVDRFGSSRIGFVKISTHTERNGIKIPGICMLRGGAVGMLLEITDEQTDEKWSILTCQPRVPTGRVLMEIPAGMIDGSGNIKGVAIKELEEECGLVAKEEDLIDMTQALYGSAYPGVYTSPGLLDEFLRLFLWKTTMPHEKILELNGKIGGESPHEQITLRLVKYNDIWRYTPDAKSLAAIQMARIIEETK